MVIKQIIFDLSEVLILGVIGAENILSEKLNRPARDIAKALGDDPFYQVDEKMDCLFIEDNLKNITNADLLELKTVHFKSEHSISEIFEKLTHLG